MFDLERKDHIALINFAILQFKLALAVGTTVDSGDKNKQAFQYLGQFSWGIHEANYKQLKLSPREEKFSASLLEHTAIYLLAVQIDTAFEKLIPNRLNHPDEQIQSATIIARLIRNSFAHNPFAPMWLIPKKHQNKRFEVSKTIHLDTDNINGKPVSRSDYGGPLALLALAKFSLKALRTIS